MTTFIGDYECKVDAKGRFMLPSAFKRQLSVTAQDKFVVRKDLYERCLVLFPMDEWERQVEAIRSRTNPYNKEHSRFLREFFRNTAELSLDATNRLLIPSGLMTMADIENDVVLAGMDGKIEIWAKRLYKSDLSEDEFASLADKILGSSPQQYKLE